MGDTLQHRHLARLDAVIADDAFVCTTNRAKALRRRIANLDPGTAHGRGMLGANGYGPAVDDVVREAAIHARHRLALEAAFYGRRDAEAEVERVAHGRRAA